MEIILKDWEKYCAHCNKSLEPMEISYTFKFGGIFRSLCMKCNKELKKWFNLNNGGVYE